MRQLISQFGKTVRWRLTLWYTLVLCLTFIMFSVIVDHLTARQLYAQVDRNLADTMVAVTSSLNQAYREDPQHTSEHLREEIAELGLPAETLLQVSWPD